MGGDKGNMLCKYNVGLDLGIENGHQWKTREIQINSLIESTMPMLIF